MNIVDRIGKKQMERALAQRAMRNSAQATRCVST